MTARKDLLEAQAFQRRRLLVALVGGASSRDEPAGSRPGRLLLGGIGVAVLVVVGGVLVQLVR